MVVLVLVGVTLALPLLGQLSKIINQCSFSGKEKIYKKKNDLSSGNASPRGVNMLLISSN